MAYKKTTTYVYNSKKEYKENDDGTLSFSLNHKREYVYGTLESICKGSLVYNSADNFKSESTSSGVYAFILENLTNNECDVAYVGSSSNLNMRLYCHLTLRFLKAMKDNKCSMIVATCETSDYKDIEWRLIRALNPFLNSEYNKKVRKEFIFPT